MGCLLAHLPFEKSIFRLMGLLIAHLPLEFLLARFMGLLVAHLPFNMPFIKAVIVVL